MLWVNVFLNRTRLLCAMLIAPVILSGCSTGSGIFSLSRATDYSAVECEALWQMSEPRYVNDTAYWLGLTQCVKQLSAKEAQAQVKNFTEADWVTLFKRSVVLSHLSGTDAEQRKVLTQLTKVSKDTPIAVNQLIDLWTKRQQLHFSLQAEKVKYQRLKDNSDEHIKALTDELSSVKVKLQSLADIETEMTRKTTAR